jgi:hypothetical protein
MDMKACDKRGDEPEQERVKDKRKEPEGNDVDRQRQNREDGAHGDAEQPPNDGNNISFSFMLCPARTRPA